MKTFHFHRSVKKLLTTASALSLFLPAPAFAKQLSPWPLGNWQKADHSLSRLDSSFHKNLSGSHWDTDSRQLLLVVNKPGTVIVLQYGENGFHVKNTFSLKGDLEGITKIPHLPQDIFVLEEKKAEILRFRQNKETLQFVQSWDISDYLPNSGGLGPEGITFIPNSDLKHLVFSNKRNINKDMFNGVFCIAHQNGGNLYFFDLQENEINYLGELSTREKESSGLEYDEKNKHLYIWHNIDNNSLEIVYLKPTKKKKKLLLVSHFQGPKKGNLESVAVGPIGNSTSLFLTDDDNQDNISILWYKDWPDIKSTTRKK